MGGIAGTEKPKPSFDPATQIGAMAPLGYFDPAGFSKKGDESGFRTLRAAEIKHGRVAMMAAVGAVVQHYVKLPGFDEVPSGLSAVNVAPGSYGMIALFVLAGALELGAWTEDPSKEPGNFGDPLGLGMYDDEMRAREINNGRFAMFAALGIISAELLTGKDAIEQLGFLKGMLFRPINFLPTPRDWSLWRGRFPRNGCTPRLDRAVRMDTSQYARGLGDSPSCPCSHAFVECEQFSDPLLSAIFAGKACGVG